MIRRISIMSCEIIQMNENSWRIEDGGVRFFLLAGTEKALLIDSGMTVSNAKDIAESITPLPVFLLNTHADRDHIGSNEQFDTFYMHPLEEPVYRRSEKPGTIIPVREGMIIDLGNRELEIIELPGHTPGSIAVLDRSHKVLISGDPIQKNGHIFMFGSHRDMGSYIQSLTKLEQRISEFEEIWPSHADIPVSPETIRMLREGAQAILNGTVQGTPTEFRGNRIVVYDLGFCTILYE